jgi:predicted TIM-barrel fold metal-dependent hydrolase
MEVDQLADETITKFRENFRYEDHPGSWEPSARLKEQDRDGVEAEVLFSSWTRGFYAFSDAAFQRACFRSYNFWLHDFCSYNSRRLVGIPLVSVLNPQAAVQDIYEYAKMGFKGVQLPSGIKDGAYYSPAYEPIWAAAEDSNMLVVIHSGALQGRASTRWFERLESADDWPAFFQHARQTVAKTIVGQMIFSGLFDRHPKLKVICAEFDAGWLGVIVQQVNYHYGPKKAARGTTVGQSIRVKLPPSEYFKRNLWFTFMDDRTAVLAAPVYGEDNFMWSSDYPHAACTWPYSQPIVDRMCQGVEPAVKRKLCRENVNQLYNLGL